MFSPPQRQRRGRPAEQEHSSLNSSDKASHSERGGVSATTSLAEKLQYHHIKYDEGIYEGYDINEEDREEDSLMPDDLAEAGGWEGIEIPEGAPGNLTCEECEKRRANTRCDTCQQVFCPRCVALCHLTGANGAPHQHLASGYIRRLRPGDSSCIVLADARAIPANELLEEDLAELRDLSVPSALEAPKINLAGSAAARNNSALCHQMGDLVVFEARAADCLPDGIPDLEGPNQPVESSGSGAPAKWREKELYGWVLSLPRTRQAEWGAANIRGGESHELYCRVQIEGYATGAYDEPLVERWLAHQAKYSGPVEGIKIVGGSTAAPLVLERQRAFERDKRIKRIQLGLTAPEHELGAKASANAKAPERVVLLVPELSLHKPEAKREWLRQRRLRIIKRCEQALGHRLRTADLEYGFRTWRLRLIMARDWEWEKACQKLQAVVRGHIARHRARRMKQEQMAALLASRRRIHNQFNYLDGEGFTTDGKIYFATKHELNRYEALYRRMSQRAFSFLLRTIANAKHDSFEHWAAFTTWKREQQQDFMFNAVSDPSRIPGGGREKAEKLIHPGVVASKLPPLAPTWAKLTPDGKLQKKYPSRYNSFIAKMAGPATWCNWIVPGHVLLASYPEAEQVAFPNLFKQPAFPDAASQVLLAGVGTFVSLCVPEEVSGRSGREDFAVTFSLKHKNVLSMLKAQSDVAQHALRICEQEEKNCAMMRNLDGVSDDRRKAVLAEVTGRSRVAREDWTKASRAMATFPKDVQVVHAPIEDDGSLPAHELKALVIDLERRIGQGEGLCIFSKHGRGRCSMVGAALLGQLYGCGAEEAMQRVRLCHAARAVEIEGTTPLQAQCQVQAVRDTLLVQEPFYTPLSIRSDLPAANHKSLSIRSSKRGVGSSCGAPILGASRKVKEAKNDLAQERLRHAQLLRGPELDRFQDEQEQPQWIDDTDSSCCRGSSSTALTLEGAVLPTRVASLVSLPRLPSLLRGQCTAPQH
ncbi:unnamed protein product [Chrysoparadoxa australica]